MQSARELLGVVEPPDARLRRKGNGGNRERARNGASSHLVYAEHKAVSAVFNSETVHLVNAGALGKLLIATPARPLASLLHLRARVVGKSVKKNVDLIYRCAAELGGDLSPISSTGALPSSAAI